MHITIDTRGLSCPMPQQMVIKAIRTMKLDEMIIVLADEAGARDSVVRTARALQLTYKLEKSGDEYKVYLFRRELWMEK
ncbi:sulfurtransferase TusA family protein [Chloroflexota bacterium]